MASKTSAASAYSPASCKALARRIRFSTLGLSFAPRAPSLAELRERAMSGAFDVIVVDCAPTGETLRLRFAETDNVNFFNMGVDNVSLTIVPTPASGAVMIAATGVLARRRRRIVN